MMHQKDPPPRRGRPLHAGAAMMRPRPAATRARVVDDTIMLLCRPLRSPRAGERGADKWSSPVPCTHTHTPDSASLSSPRLRDCVSYAWRTETRRKPRTHRSNRVQVAAAFAWHAP